MNMKTSKYEYTCLYSLNSDSIEPKAYHRVTGKWADEREAYKSVAAMVVIRDKENKILEFMAFRTRSLSRRPRKQKA